MSRKQTIKTVKIKPKAISSSIFKSKSFKIPDESDTAQIAAAVRSAATQKAERALLEDELAKPSAVRNPALMRKFGTEHLAGTVDGYPDLDKGGRFHIVATMPDDPGIPVERRPTPWSVTISITHAGHQFDYVFPFSRAVGVPEAAFRLDNFPVFLDTNHNVIVELTPEYTLYEALLDYKNNDTEFLEDREAVFKARGITKGTKLDFRIRGLGMLVTSRKLPSPVDVRPAKPDVVPTTALAVDNVPPKIVKVTMVTDPEFNNNIKMAEKLYELVKETVKYPLYGIPAETEIAGNILVDKFYASSRLNNPMIVLEAVADDGDIWAIAFAGPTSVEKLMKRVDNAELKSRVVAQNRKIIAEYEASRVKKPTTPS